MEHKTDSIAASYKAWITIKVSHDYFLNGGNGITILPTRDTHKLLVRAGVIIKQSDSGTWMLLKEKGGSEDMEERLTEHPLEFCFMNTDAGFYYYTDNNVADGAPVWELKDMGTNGIWKVLVITADKPMLAETVTITIAISSIEKFIEFLVIPKSGIRPELLLREDNGKLEFSRTEVNLPGEPLPVYRFVTTKPVALREAYNYSIKLWEVKENGESLLSGGLSFPKAASVSAISSLNTISSYFYF